ncbi:MAG: shikimate dehydrogenase [Fulvivirga sp.]
MPSFGLIGRKLGHSFSKEYFETKFDELNLTDHSYNLFELDDIDEIEKILKLKPKGLNVTVPYKEEIIPYLDRLDDSASKVGAVNVISLEKNAFVGYNSDFYGFKTSLQHWLSNTTLKALVLGTGGASKAVIAALDDLGIESVFISRQSGENRLTYSQVTFDTIEQHRLIINTTPLGMYPEVNESPDIPYNSLTTQHYLYDLVYNPEKTVFLKKGEAKGAQVKNGLQMLHLQAEKSWEIWNG